MSDTTLKANWNYPTRIWFGAGRLTELAVACRDAGVSRPLIVSDPYFSTLPVMAEIRDVLSIGGISSALFDQLQGNPTSRNLEDGIAAFRVGGHDGVIAIGGGSALDLGKTVAFMVAQERPVWDFEDVGDWWRRARTEGIAPIIAIPTTAGTGSEVGRATVITNDTTHEKKIIFHPLMMPRVVVADPALTLGLPPAMTAHTGMDALAHCLEAYCAPGYHPMADAIAVEGIRLLQRWLPVAVAQGQDIEARSHVMAAAGMGGTSFQKGLGAIHSLSHPIGSIYGYHHGLTNAVLMPYVLAHNREAVADKILYLARTMALVDSNADATTGAERFITWTLTLRERLKIPHTLRELGVKPEMFAKIAEMSVSDPTAGTNPVPLSVPASLEILACAYEGKMGPN